MTFQPRFQTLQELYRKTLSAHADRPLFGVKADGGWRWHTYADFARDVDAMRAALTELGVVKGDRVAIIADNGLPWAVSAYATYGLGAQFVPMYEAQRPKDWAFILRDSGTKVLVVASQEIADKVESLRGELPDLETVVVVGGTGPHAYEALLLLGAGKYAPMTPVTPDDIAGFIYTSGTTGDPKGVLLSHGNLAGNASAALEIFPIRTHDRSLSFLPWAHSFGQTAELHTLFAAGAAMALVESIPKIVENLAEVQPTILISVPRIFNRIYDGLHTRMAETGGVQAWLFHKAVDVARQRRHLARDGRSSLPLDLAFQVLDRVVLSKVRARFGGRLEYAISGGAALSPEIAEFMGDLGIVVFEGYGLTETSPVVAANHPEAHRIGTVGKPLPGVRIALDHEITGDAVDGELIVYGHCVMQGYHGLPDENAKVFTEDGGLRTGDMARLSDDGFLSITGRIKEQYKLENGKYVVPTPLEEQLKLAPLVASALIHGSNKPYNVALIVPDWEVAARWARDHGVPETPATLLQDRSFVAAVKAQVAHRAEAFKGYERPKEIALLEDDFTTDNGMLTPSLKVKRRVVLAAYGDLVESLYS